MPPATRFRRFREALYTSVYNAGMRFFVLISLFGLIALGSAAARAAETINIAAAVSLREALTDASAAFESSTGVHVALTLGSSGQLAAQITNGAPVDAFISAANQQVDELSKAGLVDDGTRRIVAGNALVLIVPAGASSAPQNFQQLADARIGKVAIGEPRTVPAGQYAMQVLTALKIDESLRPRLIFGANVRQVLAYVERGEVAAGVVYATDAKAAGGKVRVVATADASTHEPIVYPAVVIKPTAHRDAAVRFLDFLATEQGRAALEARGFTPGSRARAGTE
jgi:molybdate transport system substrate-binding protein